jgi:DNA-binding transcriptional LysR family regulator
MLSVTLRRLEVFLTVAEAGGFAAAANRLGISQPSVSAHMAALEQEAKGELFERSRGRKVRLTELGDTFRGHAERLLKEAEDLSHGLERTRLRANQRIVFACQRSLANFLLSSTMAEFASAHRDAELVVRVGAQEEIVAQVRDGSADVGYVLANEDPAGVRAMVVGQERLLLIAAPTHPLAQRRAIPPAELIGEAYVGSPPGSAFGREVRTLLRRAGIEDLRTVAQATEYAILRDLVAAGMGFACSPERGVKRDLEAGVVAVLDLAAPPMLMEIRQLTTARGARSAMVKTFVGFLRDRSMRESRAPSET